MLANTMDEIKRKRATFARDVEYLKEISNDDAIDYRVEAAESLFVGESIEELEEAADMVRQLDINSEVVAESTEIEKIMNAEDDITFEEMIGI